MRCNTFPWHQEGTSELVRFLLGMGFCQITALPMEHEVTQLMCRIEATPLSCLHHVEKYERHAFMEEGKCVYIRVFRGKREHPYPVRFKKMHRIGDRS